MFPYDNTLSQTQTDIQRQLQQMMIGGNKASEHHVTKVNGRAGAESYILAANSDDILLDMNDPIIWFVQTDGAGYKTITPYDISPHKEVKPEDQYKALEDRISKLEEMINNGKPDTTAYTKPAKPRNEHYDAGGRSNDKRGITTAVHAESGTN